MNRFLLNPAVESAFASAIEQKWINDLNTFGESVATIYKLDDRANSDPRNSSAKDSKSRRSAKK